MTEATSGDAAPADADGGFPRWMLLLVPAALGLVTYVYATVGRPACNTANAFLAAVEQGDVEAARAETSPELARWLDALRPGAPAELRESEQGRTLLRLRATPPGEMTMGQLGAGLSRGCFVTDLADGRPARIVVAEVQGVWRVEDVRSETRLPICESDP